MTRVEFEFERTYVSRRRQLQHIYGCRGEARIALAVDIVTALVDLEIGTDNVSYLGSFNVP